jgi:hypothetical protein
MSRKPLDPSVVAERMIRLRNLEKLYKLSKQRQNLQNKQVAALKRTRHGTFRVLRLLVEGESSYYEFATIKA